MLISLSLNFTIPNSKDIAKNMKNQIIMNNNTKLICFGELRKEIYQKFCHHQKLKLTVFISKSSSVLLGLS